MSITMGVCVWVCVLFNGSELSNTVLDTDPLGLGSVIPLDRLRT